VKLPTGFVQDGTGAERHRRNVGNIALAGTIDIPPLHSRLTSDCEREITKRIQLVPGDVEALSLARARTRWPDYRAYVQAVAHWMCEMGLPEILEDANIALMACRGARYHHDAEQYGSAAFCNLFLSQDKGLDLIFPCMDKRIALQRGTVVMFDTAQPHAVIDRNSTTFHEHQFLSERDCSVFFLTWELPVANELVASALGVMFNCPTASGLQVVDQILVLNGAPVGLCPETGRWQTP
jgi:hypothetical protein